MDDLCRVASDGSVGPDGAGPRVDAGEPADAGNRLDGGVLPPGECRITPSADPFENPQLDLHWNATGELFPDYSQAIHSPVVIDFLPEPPDSDLIPELLFLTYRDGSFAAGVLRVVSGRPPYETRMTVAGDGTGAVVDDSAATPSFLQDCHPAAGDLDGDGWPEIVISLRGGGAVAIRNDGTEYWRTSADELPNAEISPNGSWAIHDLEGDGVPEVVVGRTVLEGRTGEVRFIGDGSRGRNGQGPLSCVADIVASSPGQEIIAGHTVYSATGDTLWTAEGDTADGFCAVADVVDASGAAGRDGTPEVIRVAGGRVRINAGEDGTLLANLAMSCASGAVGRGGGSDGGRLRGRRTHGDRRGDIELLRRRGSGLCR